MIRMSKEKPPLTDKRQLNRDISYMEFLLQQGYTLTQRSISMRWFPCDLQEVFEPAAQCKRIEKDFDGLLSLISLAGPEFGKYEYMKLMINKGYGINGRPITRDSQQNLAFLLLGTVMDDVSEGRAPLSYLRVLTIFFDQSCRLLEQLQKCCHNPKAFQGFILKLGSQYPGKMASRMIQVMAVGVMYRLAMMLLKKNEVKIFKQIDANPNQIGPDIQEIHRKKIRKLLAIYYPTYDGTGNRNTPKQAWGQLER